MENMGSQQTLADQAGFQAQLFRQCQQKKLYQQALIRVRDTRNDGDALLSSAILFPNTIVQFTQDQLDMRRKAEILQYAGPSTQGGKRESKLKEWSRVNQRSRSYTSYLDVSCASLVNNRPTSTTESNVPGPPQMIVYDPNVTLYYFKGMRQDMRQVGVPSPSLPPFNFVSFSTNVSTANYKSGSYNVFQESPPLPLNIASVTYFNNQRSRTCSVTFNLDAIVSFHLVNPGQPAYSNRVPVDSLELIVKKIEPQIYVMTEPQIFTPDFLLSTVTLAQNFAKNFPRLPMDKKDGNYVFKNYTQTYEIANNSLLNFSVSNQKIMELVQQTDRIALNVEFDLLVYDVYNADINPALSINMDQLTIQLVLTPTSVLLE